MKHIKLLCSVLCCLILCTMLAVTVSAEYTLTFTRDEAYDAVMNIEPDDAVRAYGGREEYINALTQNDKDQLFNVLWAMVEDGSAWDTSSDVNIDSFSVGYFNTITSAFEKADTTDEGLENLRNAMADSGYATQPTQTTATSKITDGTDQTTTTTSTTVTTTAQQTADEPSTWIWILAIVAFGVLGIAIYLMFRKKK